jgi:hypothetical protein
VEGNKTIEDHSSEIPREAIEIIIMISWMIVAFLTLNRDDR